MSRMSYSITLWSEKCRLQASTLWRAASVQVSTSRAVRSEAATLVRRVS